MFPDHPSSSTPGLLYSGLHASRQKMGRWRWIRTPRPTISPRTFLPNSQISRPIKRNRRSKVHVHLANEGEERNEPMHGVFVVGGNEEGITYCALSSGVGISKSILLISPSAQMTYARSTSDSSFSPSPHHLVVAMSAPLISSLRRLE